MSELLEIIIEAVDQASDTFQSVVSSAEDMGDTISGSVDEADSSFDDLESAADAASSSVEDVGAAADSLDGSGATEVASNVDEIEQEANESTDALDTMNTAIASMAGAEAFSGIADALMEAADTAGRYEDSMTRVGLAAEGAGIDVDTMKTAVTNLASETGRAGGSIRESFIQMTSAGITDMGTMQSLFKGASAQAFILGTDVESLANKFSGMAMKSTLSDRTLKGTGVTMQELGQAMGMQGASIDEVKEKWKELDVNQRAAALGMAASMNEGKNANEQYKHSWEGLQAQLDIAKSRLQRLAGEVLLPVLVPAIELAGRVLNGLGDIISNVMQGPFSGLVSAIGAIAAGIALAIPAYMALSGAMTFIVGPAWAAATAMWAAAAPLLPFIAIAAVVALAIYEVGKAFGWWHDVGSLVDAIWAGVMQLWEAFINHPDVQAIIQAMTDAWNWLAPAVTNAWNAVMKFLGTFNGGQMDFVGGFIRGVGMAWQFVTQNIRTVITVVQLLINAFSNLYNGTIMPLSEYITGVFGPVWNGIIQVLGVIINTVTGLIGAFELFKQGQINLPTLVMSVLSLLFNAYTTIFAMIGRAVLNFAARMLSSAATAGRNLLTGISNYLRLLPGRVLAYLQATYARIVMQLNKWVSTSRSKALNMLNAIVNYIKTLPGKMLSYFSTAAGHILNQGQRWVEHARTKAMAVLTGVGTYISKIPERVYNYLSQAVDKIISAGQAWVDAAKEKAEAVVEGVGDALSNTASAVESALGGVAEAIVAPFREAYNTAKGIWDSIASLASSTPTVRASAGGEGMTEFLESGSGSSSVRVNGNLGLNVKVSGIPDSTDSKNVEKIFNRMLNDKSFKDKLIREIAGSTLFQSLDAKEKQRLLGKSNRSLGV